MVIHFIKHLTSYLTRDMSNISSIQNLYGVLNYSFDFKFQIQPTDRPVLNSIYIRIKHISNTPHVCRLSLTHSSSRPSYLPPHQFIQTPMCNNNNNNDTYSSLFAFSFMFFLFFVFLNRLSACIYVRECVFFFYGEKYNITCFHCICTIYANRPKSRFQQTIFY